MSDFPTEIYYDDEGNQVNVFTNGLHEVYDKEGGLIKRFMGSKPTVTAKKESEFEDLVEDGLIEDEDGEWND